MLDLAQGKILLSLARHAIAEHLGAAEQALPEATWLQQPGATFVTLTLQGQLRGCIGSLLAYRELIDDVRQNALAAAFHDPRFPAVSKYELPEISVEVSLLTPPEPMQITSEQDAVMQLRPLQDGVILEAGIHRATFLPQVWEQLPDPIVFLAHLKNKAGLPTNYWSENVQLSRYAVQKWKEEPQHG
ncbi:MAG: AmmeMemoRadiSam system protein A [Gallionellaceae bacterium]